MIVDTSVLIAILRKEIGWQQLIDRLLLETHVRISAGTLIEARMVAEREGGRGELNTILADGGFEVVSVDSIQVDHAIDGSGALARNVIPRG